MVEGEYPTHNQGEVDDCRSRHPSSWGVERPAPETDDLGIRMSRLFGGTKFEGDQPLTTSESADSTSDESQPSPDEAEDGNQLPHQD